MIRDKTGWKLDATTAVEFAREWETAWNDHDIERVLARFDDDAKFRSPVADRVMPGSDGILRGKEAIRDYWSKALLRIPDLRFAVLSLFVGIETLVICYKNQKDVEVAEVLVFDGERIVEGMGTYPPAILDPAGIGSR